MSHFSTSAASSETCSSKLQPSDSNISVRFLVNPSGILKSHLLGHKQLHKRASDDLTETRALLLTEDLKVERYESLKLLRYQRRMAEKQVARKRHGELHALLAAERDGERYYALSANHALQVARSTRDMLEAEKRVVDLRVEECLSLLEALQEKAERVRDLDEAARTQVGSLLEIFNKTNTYVDRQVRTVAEGMAPLCFSNLEQHSAFNLGPACCESSWVGDQTPGGSEGEDESEGSQDLDSDSCY